MKDQNTKFHIIYAVMIAVFAAIIIWLACRCDQPSMTDELYSDAVSYESGWHTADGTEVNISKLQKLDEAVPYTEFSIYNILPTIWTAARACSSAARIYSIRSISAENLSMTHTSPKVRCIQSPTAHAGTVSSCLRKAAGALLKYVRKAYTTAQTQASTIYT